MEEVEYLYALISLFTLVVIYYTWHYTRKLNSTHKKNTPLSPPTLPIIGNLHQLGQLPHRSLYELSKKYGPLMFLKFGSKPTVVVSTAEAAKEVLKTHDISFAEKPIIDYVKKVFYDFKDLIHLPYGDQWKKIRNIFLHELLSSKRVKSFNSIREEEISILMEKIKQYGMASSPVNLTDMFAVFTNDLICRAAFGKKHSESDHGKKILDMIDEGVRLLFDFNLGQFVPWLSWINRLNGFDVAINKVVEKRDEILDAVVEDHLNRASGSSSGDTVYDENFIDILLGIYQGNTPDLSIDLITLKGAILDVFAAGIETSATTLTWVMTELIRHPTVMKKLQEEIREVMKGKHRITDDELQKMHYLKAVIKENYRCHPPVAMYVHAARENVNLMGYDIQPKTMTLINVWAIGRDPAYWHEPEKFMPERFLGSDVDFRGFHFQLIPFGGGRRMCPGLGFSVTAIEHTVANLVREFGWTLPDGMKVEDLDVTEKHGFTVRRKDPLIVVPTNC